MPEQPVSQPDTSSLESLTLALVVGGMGAYTDKTVADLRRYVEAKAITHSSVELDASLAVRNGNFSKGTPISFSAMESPAGSEEGSRPPPTRCSLKRNALAVGFHQRPAKGPASKRRWHCYVSVTGVNYFPSSRTAESGKLVGFCATSGSGEDLARRCRDGAALPVRSHS